MPEPIQGWPTPENYGDLDLYDAYTSRGGSMSWTEWLNAGKPKDDSALPGTPEKDYDYYERGGGKLSYHDWLVAGRPSPPSIDQDQLDYDAYTASGGKLSKPDWLKAGKPSDAKAEEAEAEKAEAEKAEKARSAAYTDPSKLPPSPPPPGHKWEWDNGWQPKAIESKKGGNITTETDAYGNVWEVEEDPVTGAIFRRKVWSPPEGPTEQEKWEYKKKKDEEAAAQANRDRDYQAELDRIANELAQKKIDAADAARQEEAARLAKEREDRLAKEAADRAERAARDAAEAADRQRRFDLENRQFAYGQQLDTARMAAEKESRLANLRTSPASWLQYSLEANQIPVVQPWQKPLMPQQYGNLNVGQPIPGWAGLNQGTANLPELTTPSTQYFSRIGPTAQQQWGGYQQMQSGAPLEESFWRLGQQTAPGGRNPGLSWLR